MKGLEFVFLGIGSVIGAFIRYKITEQDLLDAVKKIQPKTTEPLVVSPTK